MLRTMFGFFFSRPWPPCSGTFRLNANRGTSTKYKIQSQTRLALYNKRLSRIWFCFCAAQFWWSSNKKPGRWEAESDSDGQATTKQGGIWHDISKSALAWVNNEHITEINVRIPEKELPGLSTPAACHISKCVHAEARNTTTSFQTKTCFDTVKFRLSLSQWSILQYLLL